MSLDLCLTAVNTDLQFGLFNSQLRGTTGGMQVRTPNLGALDTMEGAEPVLPTDFATKNFVEGLVNGLSWKEPVRLCTAAALAANTQTGAGATLTADAVGAIANIDGVAPALNDRILVRSEAAASTKHGIYEVTQLGDGGNPWILTRTDDALVGFNAVNNAMFCEEGATGADTAFVQTVDAPATYNATALTFTLFSSVVSGVTSVALDGGAVGVSPITSPTAPVPTFTGFTGQTGVLSAAIVGQDIEYSVDNDGIDTAQIAGDAVGNTELAPLAAVTCITGQVLFTDVSSTVLIGVVPPNSKVVQSSVNVTTAFTNPTSIDLQVNSISRQGTDKADLATVGQYVCNDSTDDVGNADAVIGVSAGLVAGVADVLFCYRRVS